MAENLYQLRSRRKMLPGEYFAIDGPHDIHGVVIKCEEKLDKMHPDKYLNLVRGIGRIRKDKYS
jgi:hypothetical protein